MNPYDAPSAEIARNDSTPEQVVGRRARQVRSFGVFHQILCVLWANLAGQGLYWGFRRLGEVNDPNFMKQFANPDLYARSETTLAAMNLGAGVVMAVMALVGGVLVYGLWTLKRWTRWLALVQSGFLALAGGIVAVGLIVDKHYQPADALLWMLPGLFLFSLLLWSPRLRPVFVPVDGAGRAPR
jgi:hypothetical protein